MAAIKKELETLATFRQTEQVRRFRRQLVGEYSHVKRQMTKMMTAAAATVKPPSPAVRRAIQRKANRNRSEKMKREWRYFGAIQENYLPDKSTKEIRSLFTKRRKGMEVDVDDFVWRKPSP
jgi:hypothetical protein